MDILLYFVKIVVGLLILIKLKKKPYPLGTKGVKKMRVKHLTRTGMVPQALVLF